MKRFSIVLNMALIGITFLSCELTPKEKELVEEEISFSKILKEYPNVLNVKGTPKAPKDRSIYVSTDKGAWFGYSLPTSRGVYGGFSGPFLIANRKWIAPSFSKFTITREGERLNIENATILRQNYYPGYLEHVYSLDGLEVSNYLIFADNKTALIQVSVKNTSENDANLQFGWEGDTFYPNTSFKQTENGVDLIFDDSSQHASIRIPKNDMTVVHIKGKDEAYEINLGKTILLKSGGVYKTNQTQLVTFKEDDLVAAQKKAVVYLSQSKELFEENQARWEGYLKKVLFDDTGKLISDEYDEVAVKCVLTLVNNWRRAAGELKYDGLFPSYAYGGFHGFWSWDSWKHSVALANFDPELAKDQIRTMYAHQNEYGMIADVVYRDVDEEGHNWRDTKPPLSAWAIWNVYELTHDKAFIEEMYNQLEMYHKWWYKHRDHDGDKLCEYGSTDGTRIAAAWESGMDNAVRFDKAIMVKNLDTAWSLNQESVDLNSYLYAEKLYLSKINDVLGNEEKAEVYKSEAEVLSAKIREEMYDPERGYFYDKVMESDTLLVVDGPEGWIPLWTGVATQEQADKVKDVMLDTAKFATFVPFPTLNVSHPEFDPLDGYWRGPVWMDQAYFAVKALEKYGYKEEALMFTKRLLDNPEGLKNSDEPIRENYHPLTGEGLNANHFSWSAAHFLLIYLQLNK